VTAARLQLVIIVIIIIISSSSSSSSKIRKCIETVRTNKTKTLPQSGESVLYCVCVWSLSLISSSTQYGSLLPPISADFRSYALSTIQTRKHSR